MKGEKNSPPHFFSLRMIGYRGLCVVAGPGELLRVCVLMFVRLLRMRSRRFRSWRFGHFTLPSSPFTLRCYRSGQAARALSTARLHVLPRFYLPPINVVVSHGPSGVLRPGRIHLGQGFPLRCVQRFSRPGMATRRCIWQHNRYTRGQSVPVLSY